LNSVQVAAEHRSDWHRACFVLRREVRRHVQDACLRARSVALEGYCLTRLSLIGGPLAFAASVALIFPTAPSDLTGPAILIMLSATQRLPRSGSAPAAVETKQG
jgi:hypothetical protein